MNEILHANIFFLIATIATVVFCVLLSFILYHVLKIVKSLRAIIERIEAGSEVIARDVAQVRELVVGGGIWSRAIQFFIGRTRDNGKKRQRVRTEA
ncbi:hypothetical protein GW766_02630 [Candidatus Parcubacteria bacterium]|nr:hypothetical protein [Candidatus Parcubacteria bacterium]